MPVHVAPEESHRRATLPAAGMLRSYDANHASFAVVSHWFRKFRSGFARFRGGFAAEKRVGALGGESGRLGLRSQQTEREPPLYAGFRLELHT